MKEIKEEVKREVKEVVTSYEASDGTRFTDPNECLKYETSAKCVLRSRVMKLIVSKGNDAWELLGGFDDHTVTAFKMNTIEDVNLLKQFLLLECPWYSEREDLREKKFQTIEEAYKNKDVVLFGINCDGDYYFINSRQNIINNLNALDKKE